MEIDDIMGAKEKFVHSKAIEDRRIPYPPSFNKIAAKIIDPATGASTWALGSQRWAENRGIFTMKAAMVMSHHIGASWGAVQGGCHERR